MQENALAQSVLGVIKYEVSPHKVIRVVPAQLCIGKLAGIIVLEFE